MKTIYKAFFIGLITVVALNHGLTQNDHGDDVLLTLDSKDVVMGDKVCFDLRVFSFDSINSVQASIVFDPYQLRFDSLDNLNPDIPFTSESFGFTELDCGIFRFNFFRVEPTFTFDDSTRIFSLCFTAVGEPGKFAPVNLSDFPLEVEVIRNFLPVDVNTTDGGAHIEQPAQLQSAVRTCAATDIASEDGLMYATTFADDTIYPVEFFYSHDNDAFFQGSVILSSNGQEAIIDSLIPGDYSYMVVKDGDTLSSGNSTVYDHGPLFSAFNVNPPSCHDDSDGYIELVGAPEDRCVIGKWDNGAIYQPIDSALSNGTYYHTLIDKGGCQLIDTFVFETEPLEVAIEVTDNQCPGDSTGSIVVNATGGTPFSGDTYMYSWENGESQTTVNALRDELPSGIYELTVTDANECSVKHTIEIINESGLTADIQILEQITCTGDSNGVVQIDFGYEGIEGPAGFSFEPGFSTGDVTVDTGQLTFSGLPAGVYELSITDTLNAGCSLDLEFELTEGDTVLHFELTDIRDEACPDLNDGLLSLNIAGGIPDADGNYSVLWSNGVEGVENSGLSGGVYHVTVSDERNCTLTDSFELSTGTAPTITDTNIEDVNCYGDSSGSVIVQIMEGSNGPAEVFWDHGFTGDSLIGIPAGIYNGEVIDTAGCAVEFSVVVGQPDSFTVAAEVTDASAPGESDGSIVVDVSGGTSPYIFDWADNVPFSEENEAFDLPAGEYCLTITDSNDCMWQGCFEVDQMTNVNELDGKQVFSVYPNPASKFVTIELDGESGQKKIQGLRVFSADSKEILNMADTDASSIKIPVGDWTPGVYFLSVEYKGGTAVQTVVIQP